MSSLLILFLKESPSAAGGEISKIIALMLVGCEDTDISYDMGPHFKLEVLEHLIK